MRAIVFGPETDRTSVLRLLLTGIDIPVEFVETAQRLERVLESLGPGDFVVFDCAAPLPAELVERVSELSQLASLMRPRQPHAPSDRPRLSPREWEVLDLIGQDMSDREIAERLGLSLGTVKRYVSRIKDKMGLSTRAQMRFVGRWMTR